MPLSHYHLSGVKTGSPPAKNSENHTLCSLARFLTFIFTPTQRQKQGRATLIIVITINPRFPSGIFCPDAATGRPSDYRGHFGTHNFCLPRSPCALALDNAAGRAAGEPESSRRRTRLIGSGSGMAPTHARSHHAITDAMHVTGGGPACRRGKQTSADPENSRLPAAETVRRRQRRRGGGEDGGAAAVAVTVHDSATVAAGIQSWRSRSAGSTGGYFLGHSGTRRVAILPGPILGGPQSNAATRMLRPSWVSASHHPPAPRRPMPTPTTRPAVGTDD